MPGRLGTTHGGHVGLQEPQVAVRYGERATVDADEDRG
jgi:hypothetical protein